MVDESMRGRKHHGRTRLRKRRRRVQERDRVIKMQRESERVERDAQVTAEYGEPGHSACGKKIRYKTKSEALVKASTSAKYGAPALRVYRCPYCGGWHLTSKM